MIKVANRPVLARLARCSLRSDRRRLVTSAAAIALTAALFTTTFTIGGTLLRTTEESTMRQVGGRAHAGAKLVTREEYERLAAAPSVRDISYTIFAGLAENDALRKRQTEIRYSEADAARWSFSYPTSGLMPQSENEAAMSTTTLDALGIPHEAGQAVALEFTVHGTRYRQTFTLSGFWEGDPVMPADQVWLSRAYIDKIAPTPTVSYLLTDLTDIAGYISADIWFANSLNIQANVDALVAECGFAAQEINTGVNWAYTTSDIDPMMALTVIFVCLLIMLSGGLIIYNIFTISVSRDIRFYGLLKTIGATGRQLRRIVRQQAFFLAAIGMAPGLAAGWLLGVVLAPVMLGMTTFNTDNFRLSANPLIFLCAALFSLATVYASCTRPCRLAARVSPLEALRHTEADSGRNKHQRTRRITPFSLAVANTLRNKRKLVVVTLSLSLSMILLNGIYSAIQSFDMEKYLSLSIASDFSVTDASILSPQLDDHFEDVPQDFLTALAAEDGVTGMGSIYFKENLHRLSADAKENALRAYDALYEAGEESPYLTQATQQVRDAGIVPVHVYGIDRFVADKIVTADDAGVKAHSVDWDKLSSGDYVLVTAIYTNGGDNYPYYKKGDRIPLDTGGGEIREYTVLDMVDYPDPFACGHSHLTDIAVILAAPRFFEIYGETNPMMTVYDADDSALPALERWTANECAVVHTNLAYRSRATYVQEFEGLKAGFMTLGGALSFILALIGVLNFFNSMITSILSRRHEIAVMQSVALSFAQLRAMLTVEGLCYALSAILFTCVAGPPLAGLIAYGLAGQAWFFTWRFSLAPSLICFPVLLLICAVTPALHCQSLRAQSAVERLRDG